MNTNKILVLLMIGIFVFSSTGGFIGAGEKTLKPFNDAISGTEEFQLAISPPAFTEEGEFITIELDQSETFMSHSGEPMLPVVTKTFDFPVGTRINEINVDINWEQYDLDRKVTPTPVIIPLSASIDPAVVEELRINEDVYSSNNLYPSEPYIIKTGAGLKDMEHVIFVNVKCFPQYSPANNYVNIPTKIEITIDHEFTDPHIQSEDQFDLIIITHDVLEEKMQPLVAHKESKGITTKMVTVDEIYEEYASESSYDCEQIKMYLADHVADWDTKYVLLAGGHKGQTHDWYVPDFRSHCWDPEDTYDPPYDETYSSDLYFADVYYADQFGHLIMDNWDSNDNGIYAEGPDMPSGTDNMDFYPDVHLGRIPLRYEWEVDIAVNKIIDYENNADDSWFKKAVLAGGDGFPPERYGNIADPDLWEGEIVCDEFADLLSNKGVVSTKCYCSDEGDILVKSSEDVYNEVNKGCGFAHLTGHASPFVLGSYRPGTGISPPPLVPFYTGFNIIQFDNEGKLPFMICEGCHNAQFDVTTQDLIESIFDENPEFVFGRFEWIPHDANSWFVLQEGGGAIAVIGNTALGLGGLNQGCTEFVGGWIMLRFAEAYGVDNQEYTGSVWTTGINGYIDNFDVMGDTGDRKTIEERVLIGDPSVKLGGYGSFSNPDGDEGDGDEYGPVLNSAPIWTVGDSWTYALNNIDIDLTPTEGRSVTLKLSSGDIKLEVTDETSDTYLVSITTEDIDATFGVVFDFHIEDKENINIPTVNFENINIDGQMTVDKETLGIINIDLGLNIDLAENLNAIGDLLQLELPNFVNVLIPFMSIPANIDINLAFAEPFELLQFPLEQDNKYGISANIVTVSIDGSIESIWLRILNLINKIIPIIPEELAQYLPNIDISEILNDFGIETMYDIEIAETLEIKETPVFQVKGSENINTQAGSFNAATVSFLEGNANIYYAETEGNIVKIIGHVSDYIPLIEDINIELTN